MPSEICEEYRILILGVQVLIREQNIASVVNFHPSIY